MSSIYAAAKDIHINTYTPLWGFKVFWNHLYLYRNKKKLRKTEKRKLKKHSKVKLPVITITHYFCLQNLVKDIISDFPGCKFSIITKYIIINVMWG